jgi:Zn-finger nucleic acid-binding protein
MQNRSIKSVNVDECSSCNGVWFDEDELRKAKDKTDSDLNWMDFELWKHGDRFRVSAKPVKCPKCSIDMAAIVYGETGVEIDHCVKCKGIWLDGGEFKKIIEALTDELETKSALEYVRASLDEALEIFTGPESFISEWRDFLTVMTMLEYRILTENPELSKKLVAYQEEIHRRIG